MSSRFSVESVFKAVDRVTAPVTRMQNRVGKFTRSMSRGFRSADKSLSKVISSLRSGVGAAVKFGTIGVGAITASVGLLVREFSKIENAEAAFTPLMGGAKRAKEMVQALNDTATSTPFQFETLTSSVNHLLPVMDGNIEKTIKTLRMLGDTAGGNAQKLESITRGFTKAMLKGKVDMESLNMIAEAGVPIFDDLADVMGVKVNASFFKMISAGKITTAQLTKAFEKMTAKGGKFYNGMEIASKTTTGLFSTLKDNISLTAAELGGVLAPTIKDLIKRATDVARKVRDWVKNNRELINVKFTEFVNSAKESIKKLISAIQNLNDENNVFERLKSFVSVLTDAIIFLGKHGSTIAKTIAAVVALSLVLKTLTVVLGIVNLVMMANPIGLIVIAVLAAIVAFTALVAWIDDVAAAFDKMNPVVRALLAPLELVVRTIKFIKDAFKDGFGAAASKFALSFGLSDDKQSTNVGAQVVSPQERVARSIDEQKTTSSAEVTIRDESGRAEVTSGNLGKGLSLQKAGDF